MQRQVRIEISLSKIPTSDLASDPGKCVAQNPKGVLRVRPLKIFNWVSEKIFQTIFKIFSKKFPTNEKFPGIIPTSTGIPTMSLRNTHFH